MQLTQIRPASPSKLPLLKSELLSHKLSRPSALLFQFCAEGRISSVFCWGIPNYYIPLKLHHFIERNLLLFLLQSEGMSKVRDRTEDFKDFARRSALSLGYDESKTAALLASFIMHKPRHRSGFTRAALKTLESIGTVEQFLMKHKKDYVDLHRTTEQERDSIEHEVRGLHCTTNNLLVVSGMPKYLNGKSPLPKPEATRISCQVTIFVKSCKEQIDVLRNSINEEDANSKGWLGLKGDNLNADTVAHKHGVVLILSEKLHSVTSQFDQLRAIRFQHAINRVTPRKKRKNTTKSNATEISASSSLDPDMNRDSEVRDTDVSQAAPIRVQEQLLDDETRALQVELNSLLDSVQETETKMVEVSALNHLMSTHVLQQAQQIELLYEQAVEATQNVELGNKELSQAIQRNSSSRTFLLLFLFVLTFSIVFLDWYS
ncbi:syntaxin-81-like isoform X1 [Capsicum annuum]|uniref:syntaxin-81-like isoform X1 n=2 Tax=Capsicum annuum TaxID=4072 RepID=UPI001FB142AC|nr:syntaxin-81-like isoform X1 [Capsicum annuum]